MGASTGTGGGTSTESKLLPKVSRPSALAGRIPGVGGRISGMVSLFDVMNVQSSRRTMTALRREQAGRTRCVDHATCIVSTCHRLACHSAIRRTRATQAPAPHWPSRRALLPSPPSWHKRAVLWGDMRLTQASPAVHRPDPGPHSKPHALQVDVRSHRAISPSV